MEPPQDLRSFLDWLREISEASWASTPEPRLADFERRGVGGTAWMPRTRWHAFGQSDVRQFEAKYELSFPDDYKLFLTTLGMPQPWMFAASFAGGYTLVPGTRPSFTDWTNDSAVKEALELPLDGLLFDIENGIWLDEWGPRPDTASDRARVVRDLVGAAPHLIPLVGHRFVANAPRSAKGYVVLSVMQTDIVEYGRDLRDHLLTELGPLLGSHGRRSPEGSANNAEPRSVPFWGAFVE